MGRPRSPLTATSDFSCSSLPPLEARGLCLSSFVFSYHRHIVSVTLQEVSCVSLFFLRSPTRSAIHALFSFPAAAISILNTFKVLALEDRRKSSLLHRCGPWPVPHEGPRRLGNFRPTGDKGLPSTQLAPRNVSQFQMTSRKFVS